jgi:outer membrane protein TolC
MSSPVRQIALAMVLIGCCLGSAAAQGSTPTPPPGLIDLPSALRLAGAQNPEILLAWQRVDEAVAVRQLAAAQLLPSLNAGTSYDTHTGPLLRSNGQIIEENRGSLYFGAGAGAVGAGTVAVPGVVWAGNISEAIYANLVTRQRVAQQRLAAQAVRNDVLLRVATAYLELLRADARVAAGRQNVAEAAEVAIITEDFAREKQGRKADAERAATDRELRRYDLVDAEGQVLVASARLAELLRLDPSVPLHTADVLLPRPLVADATPLPELLAIALVQRPELAERQAAIRAAMLELDAAKCLPFSPNVLLGYSAGSFGGGSNLAAAGIPQTNGTVLRQDRFGNFAGRQDADAVVFWSLRNLGVGNVALVRLANSNLRTNELRQLEVLDRIGAEVASAHARSQARWAQIATTERAVQTSAAALPRELERTRQGQGLPIETMDITRLVARSRFAYVDAIVDYNRAQFELYVALGQPAADFLARALPPPKAP